MTARPIEYRRHNRVYGIKARIGGKKGRYPIKCAALVRKVVVNAAANAKNKGQDPEMQCMLCMQLQTRLK
jgi:ribosomal protein L22